MTPTPSSGFFAVATVAPVATDARHAALFWATVATRKFAVATANPLTRQPRCHCGHRSHRRTADFGNDVSSIRGKVARSILCLKVVTVVQVATRLSFQTVRCGHLNFAGGHSGHGLFRVRAPPRPEHVTGSRA